MSLPLDQVITGNCIDILSEFEDNSIDICVTDPPYGINFMGREWDKALPPKKAFEEILRVLKPGSLAFVMGSPRQDVVWRMLKMLEDSGFELNQSYIDWVYKTGFPKAYDVSKGIDRKLGLLDQRKTIGHYKIPSDSDAGNAGKEYKSPNSQSKHFGISSMRVPLSEPVSELAKTWNGWKSITGLKPAHEPVFMVNKPFSESTIVDNVLKWGKGAINVDACRIPFQQSEEVIPFQYKSTPNIYGKYRDRTDEDRIVNQKGRFPANLLVSDRALDTGKISKSGILEPHHKILGDGKGNKSGEIYGTFTRVPAEDHTTYGDVGDQSRYFDLDAWAEHHGFLDVPKASKSERDFGLNHFPLKHAPIGNYEGRDLENPKNIMRTGMQDRKARNTHPTVKPILLGAYLIELGSRRGDVVLDPFCGSGSFLISAKMAGRRYIGIDIEEEWVEVSKARLSAKPFPLDRFMET